jgi:hypothetical protein
MQGNTPVSAVAISSIPNGPAALGGLFEHAARPQWGLATCVHNGERSTAYQFQDGKLRKIATSHRHLMAEATRAFDEHARLQSELAAMAGAQLARQDLQDAGQELISLDQQLQLFLGDYADGFGDVAWIKQHRTGGKRSAKRHRDPAIERAKELLGRKEMLPLLIAGRHDVVIDRVIELLSSTSLLAKKQLVPLRLLDPNAQRRAAAALSELLYGDVEMASAMQAWVDALRSSGSPVSWLLATAVPALLKPNDHICIRASAFAHQLAWMAPRVQLSKSPGGRMYARLVEVALSLREELEARELAPRDLLDVHDFTWATLRPAARKRIAAMPPAPVHNDAPVQGTTADADESEAA